MSERRSCLRMFQISVLLSMAVLFIACGNASGRQQPAEWAKEQEVTTATATADLKESYWPTKEEWKRSSPEMQGMDSAELVRLFDFITAVSIPTRSVLIVRHGYLVLEAYAPAVGPDTAQPIYSCTKSFTSALVGIALDKGYLSSLHQPVLDFFPDLQYANRDPRKRSITLENLLTMTSGVAWWEYVAFDSRNTLMQMERSSDWVQFFLDRPMVEDPGTRWNYNTGDAHMLSAIVQKKSGQTLSEFAAANLFAPIGITSVNWPADRQGISFGGRGIYMTARDMARFGYLYAREGVWDGRQIIPAEWVRESTEKKFVAKFGNDYGYLWWLPGFGFAANGHMGQRIFVIPEQDLAVVITASLASQAMMTTPEDLMRRFILPAVKSSGALPENRAGAAQLSDRIRAFGRLP